MGTVIRDDREEPYETLIQLDDGRTMRGVECQYSFGLPMQEGLRSGMVIINSNKVSQVICLSCYRRWIAARHVDTRLDELECPDCHQQGLAIETGETSIAEELLKQALEGR